MTHLIFSPRARAILLGVTSLLAVACDRAGDDESDAEPTTSLSHCADSPTPCSSDATCEDTPTGAVCTCKSGFQGDGVECNDRDECVEGIETSEGVVAACDTIAQCMDYPGSYQCVCPDGYTLMGSICVEQPVEGSPCGINEGFCPDDFTCITPPGSGDGVCRTNGSCALPGFFPDCDCLAELYCPGPYFTCGPGSLNCK